MADFVLPISSKTYETGDVMGVRFNTRGEHIDYQAGQFLRVTLPDISDPRGSFRSFSFASSPTEDFIMIATKITQSPFKQKLASLAVGDRIALQGPYGKFMLTDDPQKHHMFLSGGIGITPFRSILTYATDMKLSHRITLLYSNQTPEDIVFKEGLDTIAKENPNIKIVHAITRPTDQPISNNSITPPAGGGSRNGGTIQQHSNGGSAWENGRIDDTMIRKYIKNLQDVIFYICGPPSMVEALSGVVKGMGIAEENIKVERFTGYQ